MKHLPLTKKLMLITMGTTLVALVAASSVVITYQVVSARKQLLHKMHSLAEVLGKNAASAVIFNNPEDALRILDSVEAIEHITCVCLFDAKGDLFAVYNRAGTAAHQHPRPLPTGEHFTWKQVEVAIPIEQDGKAVGDIDVESDLAVLYQQAGTTLLVSLFAICLCSLLAWRLSRRMLIMVSEPINNLVETANRVADTQDYTLRAEKVQDDELGVLTDRFNHMLRQVHTRNAELRQAHEILQRRLMELHHETIERNKSQGRERELMERLGRSQRMESLGILAGGVAHDLNNILGPVVGYPDLILESLAAEDPVREDIIQIRDSAHKAVAVIKDLLTLGRRGQYKTETIDLNEVVHSHIHSPAWTSARHTYADIHTQFEISEDPLYMDGSAPHMTQVILNLALNAFEAMPHGGTLTLQTRRIRLEMPLEKFDTIPAGDYCVLSVSDTGGGINADDLSRIFEPFYTRKKMGRSGSGLGLAVVYGVVKDLHGFLDVASEIGVGTRFALYFPEEKFPRLPETRLAEDLTGNECILVVDDVVEQRQLATRLLQHLGYRVSTAENGHHALDIMQDKTFDLVVLDMIMDEGFDGLDTYREMIRQYPGQKCIIASGFSESARVKEAGSIGVGAFVSKPYTTESLGKAVKDELHHNTGSTA